MVMAVVMVGWGVGGLSFSPAVRSVARGCDRRPSRVKRGGQMLWGSATVMAGEPRNDSVWLTGRIKQTDKAQQVCDWHNNRAHDLSVKLKKLIFRFQNLYHEKFGFFLQCVPWSFWDIIVLLLTWLQEEIVCIRVINMQPRDTFLSVWGYSNRSSGLLSAWIMKWSLLLLKTTGKKLYIKARNFTLIE